ncbi:MAG: bifunctional adenosylcobinamide kinase/adenosylcobinamide-phosphate guanylyltransferase [Gammaproteobacteria bacterium]|jgi:adenosylcobinamide kinase/adenosylcobinamide-phosphate guanylyltransferase|tara:strand:+ start:6389 stop:6928 length:540 start_codon:yes stop_codon:yes gene_type:complete
MKTQAPKRQLFLGGARSGKSSLAEQAATATGLAVIYVATAEVHHSEGAGSMAQRVAIHKRRRPNHWRLVEQPLTLSETLFELDQEPCCVLVDCLTLWLSNHLCTEAADLDALLEQLIGQVERTQHHLILVSNEVGSGIVPMGELSRQFQDYSGLMNQQLAKVCDAVTLVVAGLPLHLKP